MSEKLTTYGCGLCPHKGITCDSCVIKDNLTKASEQQTENGMTTMNLKHPSQNEYIELLIKRLHIARRTLPRCTKSINKAESYRNEIIDCQNELIRLRVPRRKYEEIWK